MANLTVTEKSLFNPNTSYSNMYWNSYPAGDSEKRVQGTVVEDTEEKSKLKKYALPLSFVTGGAALMYYGIKKPNPEKIFRKYLKIQEFKIEKELSNFAAFVRSEVDNMYKLTADYIQQYKATHFLNPTEHLGTIKNMTKPSKVAQAQDLAFEALTNKMISLKPSKRNDIEEFRILIEGSKTKARENIFQNRELTLTQMAPHVSLNHIKDKRVEEFLDYGEDHLGKYVNIVLENRDDVNKLQLEITSRQQYNNMAQAVTEVRRLESNAKENIINTSFEKAKELLKLDEFIPSYFKPKNTSNYEKLTLHELKPTKIPPKIRSIYEDDIFLRHSLTQP